MPLPSVAAWSSFPAARSSPASRRRRSSRASPAHLTTWKASRQISARGAFSRITSWIHSAPSADTQVSSFARSGPSSSKNARTVSWQRPSPIHAISLVSWFVTIIRYLLLPLPQDFSSIPIIRSPSSRSRPAAASPATRAVMFASASHVTRSSAAARLHAMCAAFHAANSSNGLLNRSSCRAHGTAAVIFPCSPQMIRGSADSRYARLPCTSRVRHRFTSYSTGLPRCPHSGHRSRVSSSGSTTMTSTFSGARSLRGHRSIYVLVTTACSVSSTSSHTDPANAPPPARHVLSPSGTGRYRAASRPLWTDTPQKPGTTPNLRAGESRISQVLAREVRARFFQERVLHVEAADVRLQFPDPRPFRWRQRCLTHRDRLIILVFLDPVSQGRFLQPEIPGRLRDSLI